MWVKRNEPRRHEEREERKKKKEEREKMIIENSDLILSVKGLTANVDETPILKGLDLEVRAGEVHA
ncbi:hypothetical protein MEO94_33530, partial [Dolichospermum sp. ST_sed9]|nr:hypothetical protein [Dolichospermum sp. ST_sed9]